MQDAALLPRPPGGLAPGAVLALLVHVGLIFALTLAVDWRMKAPEVVSAELWAALPQVAAPKAEEPPAPTPTPPTPPRPAPTPTPVAKEAPPPDPQIAIERAERRKQDLAQKEQAAKAKAEAEAEKKKREAAEEKADEARLAKLREEQMKRMLGSLPASGAANGSASRDAAPSQAYIGRLVALIKNNVVFNDTVSGNPAAEVEVSSTASGSILSRRLVKSSGVKEWDEAVLRAVDRTGTLPRDSNGKVPSPIIITFRPKE